MVCSSHVGLEHFQHKWNLQFDKSFTPLLKNELANELASFVNTRVYAHES